MVINKNSWHYKWLAYASVMNCYLYDNATTINDMRNEGKSYVEILELRFPHMIPTNFCQYWRRVLVSFPLILAINLMTVLGILVMTITYPGAALSIIGIIFTILIIATIAVAFFIGFTEAKEIFRSKISESDSFISSAYDSYKGNICTLIEYKDNDNADRG